MALLVLARAFVLQQHPRAPPELLERAVAPVEHLAQRRAIRKAELHGSTRSGLSRLAHAGKISLSSATQSSDSVASNALRL